MPLQDDSRLRNLSTKDRVRQASRAPWLPFTPLIHIKNRRRFASRVSRVRISDLRSDDRRAQGMRFWASRVHSRRSLLCLVREAHGCDPRCRSAQIRSWRLRAGRRRADHGPSPQSIEEPASAPDVRKRIEDALKRQAEVHAKDVRVHFQNCTPLKRSSMRLSAAGEESEDSGHDCPSGVAAALIRDGPRCPVNPNSARRHVATLPPGAKGPKDPIARSHAALVGRDGTHVIA